MKKKLIYVSVIALICLTIGLAIGIVVGIKRGVPFVAEREQWTIGIYNGESPFDMSNSLGWRNPVLKAEDVTDVPAKFVADPFLIEDDSTWYMFFEVYNLDSGHGDLAVATSTDTTNWNYQQVVLDEPFHLSYPYIFKWDGDYYLIPESFEADSIRLYKATDFPYQWEFVATLIDDMALVDPSIVQFDDKWWLFAADADNKNDTLRLFLADELEGLWQEHPASPIVEANNHIARPSGRVLEYDGRLFRFTMDVNPTFGTHRVLALEITEMTPTSYEEVLVSEESILEADGSGWNSQAMHQIDPHQIGVKEWLASVDGFGTYLVFGLDY